MTFYIGCRIGLGIAVGLSFLKGIIKGLALLVHGCQYIVGGTIENTGNAVDVIGRQAVVKGANNGDAAAHTGLKEIGYLVFCCQCQKLRAMGGHQLLVGGHHALSRFQRPLGDIVGKASSTNGFNHNLNTLIF